MEPILCNPLIFHNGDIITTLNIVVIWASLGPEGKLAVGTRPPGI